MQRLTVFLFSILFAASALVVFVGADAGAEGEGDGHTTILLLGGDAGPQRVGLRTDSMMVASIDRTTGRAALFGVPRNLVNTPLPEPYASQFVCGCWESLLNELYSYAEANPALFGEGDHPGGIVMMRTIGNLLDLDIDYFALVDLPGFVRVFDALGGVEIDVPVQETVLISPAFAEDDWQQYIIPAGRQHLDGRTALAYARTREDAGDYQRMTRQRCLIGALARSADIDSLLFNYPDITNAVADAVHTNVPLKKLPDLIELVGQLDFGSLYTVGFTTNNYMAGFAGEDYYPIPDPGVIGDTVDAVLSWNAEDVSGTFGTLPASCGWQ